MTYLFRLYIRSNLSQCLIKNTKSVSTSSSFLSATLAFADQSIAVQSFRKDKAISGLFVRPSDSIADVKQKIKAELLYNPSRLLLNDQPLDDTLLVSETHLSSGCLIRAAKGKQNLKKRRASKGPGSTARRRSRKAEAQQQLQQIMADMSTDELQALRKLLNEGHEEEAEEDKASSNDVRTEETDVRTEETDVRTEETNVSKEVPGIQVYFLHSLSKLQ